MVRIRRIIKVMVIVGKIAVIVMVPIMVLVMFTVEFRVYGVGVSNLHPIPAGFILSSSESL